MRTTEQTKQTIHLDGSDHAPAITVTIEWGDDGDRPGRVTVTDAAGEALSALEYTGELFERVGAAVEAKRSERHYDGRRRSRTLLYVCADHGYHEGVECSTCKAAPEPIEREPTTSEHGKNASEAA